MKRGSPGDKKDPGKKKGDDLNETP